MICEVTGRRKRSKGFSVFERKGQFKYSVLVCVCVDALACMHVLEICVYLMLRMPSLLSTEDNEEYSYPCTHCEFLFFSIYNMRTASL